MYYVCIKLSYMLCFCLSLLTHVHVMFVSAMSDIGISGRGWWWWGWWCQGNF